MLSHLEIRKSKSEIRNVDFEIQELSKRDWRFNRDMYFQIGEKWKWIDKRPWTDAQWKEYASDCNLRTFAGYYGGEVAGYFELKRQPMRLQARVGAGLAVPASTEEEIEIAYFGLLPEFIGRGLGGALLSSAIENAWAWSPAPSRVWVHTCNRDHPNALTNYKARGFKIYRTVTSNR
jgi:GNAT superfamily N-acetyltransferase